MVKKAHPPKRLGPVVQGLTELGHSERTACRVVGMNRSTYRHQRRRGIHSNRDVRRILLADTIKELHMASRSDLWRPKRMRAALFTRTEGLVVNRKLIIVCIMADHSLSGLPLRRKKGRGAHPVELDTE